MRLWNTVDNLVEICTSLVVELKIYLKLFMVEVSTHNGLIRVISPDYRQDITDDSALLPITGSDEGSAYWITRSSLFIPRNLCKLYNECKKHFKSLELAVCTRLNSCTKPFSHWLGEMPTYHLCLIHEQSSMLHEDILFFYEYIRTLLK